MVVEWRVKTIVRLGLETWTDRTRGLSPRVLWGARFFFGASVFLRLFLI